MPEMSSPRLRLGVVGAGAMGSGIAQVAAAAGIETSLHDTRAGAAAAARDGIARRLAKRADEGKMPAAEAEATVARIGVAEGLQALAGCDVVIEAIVEDLTVKQKLFAELEAIVAPETVLASNTSSLPIGAIARGLQHRERVAGLHFFNPVPVMRLVEVIRAPETGGKVLAGLVELGRRLGREPVVVRDTPGFLVNFGGRAYATEALAILHEQVATPAQVDAVMRDCCGFRMGPFELMDLTGIDVNFPVTRFVHESFFGDPRLRSTPLHRYLLETGQLGRKSGRGFYEHGEDAVRPDADAAPESAPAEAALLLEPDERLAELAEACNLRVLKKDDGEAPILAAPVGEDCSALAARTGADYRRLVAVDLVTASDERLTAMTAPGVDPTVRDATIARLATTGRAITAIADSPGFVGQRIVAMVANLGCEMAQIGLAAPADIDTAMRLGLNYPKGPLELAEAIGPRTVHAILTQLQTLTGDDRYRPSQWLRRRAQLGVSLQTL